MAFRRPERELSVTEILSQSVSLYSSKFDLFLVPFLLTTAINSFVSYALWTFVPALEIPQDTTQIVSWLVDYLFAVIPVLVATIIVNWVVSTFSNGMVVKMSSEILEGRPATIKVGFDAVVSSLPTLLVSSAVVSVLMVLGMLFFVVPGVIVIIIFCLTVQTIIIERHGVSASLWRSRRLVTHRWSKTFIVLIAVAVLTGVSTSVGRFVGGLVVPYDRIIGLVVESIISSLTQPLQPIVLTLFYYSLRAKESLAGSAFYTQQHPPMSPLYQPNFCTKCGGRLPPDAVFCPRCGANVRS